MHWWKVIISLYKICRKIDQFLRVLFSKNRILDSCLFIELVEYAKPKEVIPQVVEYAPTQRQIGYANPIQIKEVPVLIEPKPVTYGSSCKHLKCIN